MRGRSEQEQNAGEPTLRWPEVLASLDALWSNPPLATEGQVDDESLLQQAVAVLTNGTGSHLGFISTVDLAAPTRLLSWERSFVYPSQAVWPYSRRFSLPIGGAELPRSLRSLSGYVAFTGKPYLCSDVTADAYYLASDPQVRSEVVAPLLENGRVLGVLNLQSYTPSFYTEAHLDLLSHAATRLAAPVARIRARQEQALAERDALQDTTALTERPFATHQELLSAALACLPARIMRKGLVWLVDKESLVFAASYPPPIETQDEAQRPENRFFRIGADDLPVTEPRSFVGSIAQTRQPHRVPDLTKYPNYFRVDERLYSALGAPILFPVTDTLLGVIELHHADLDYYTPRDEYYLTAFGRRLAVPLYSVLAREKSCVSPKAVRTEIRKAFGQADTSALLSKPRVAHLVARHIATALESRLCTIWLRNATGDLEWHGRFWCSRALPGSPAEQQARVWQAIHDAFGVRPAGFQPGLVARRQTSGWDALQSQELRNCGPNHDAAFFHKHYVQPFVAMPLLTYDQRALGVVHVGLKQPTPVNPHGYYTEADEDCLDSLQTEIVAFYERQHLRDTVQHAIQDLHDALRLATYNVLYGLGCVQEDLRQEDYLLVASRLGELESQTQSVLRNIRGIMLGLSSHALDELGLADALQRYLTQSVQRPALAVQFTTTGEEGHVSTSLAWQLYRIAQEALANVVKHAHATSVACQVQFEPTRITLCIGDNGQGYDPASLQPTTHYGLQTMQERAAALGGSCEIHTTPGAGTTVTVCVPRPGE